MLRKAITKIKWADSNIMASILKVLYYNIIKKNRFAIFELDLTQEFAGPSLNIKNYQVSVMTFEELARLIAGKKNLPREFYRHEIDGVRHCALVMAGDRIGHISWIYLKGDKDRSFDLKDDEAHVNYSFTFPGFRGVSFFPEALRASAVWLKDRNYRRIIMDVHEETTFMINSMQKIKEVKRIGTLTHWFLYRPKFNN